jgi:histidine phosphotransferase ChpT
MQDIFPGLRLAELLAARLCHELVSPVGAIANGVEILEDEPDFARDAGKLIEQSVREARRRLQFYRIAYGAVGEVTTAAARKAALDLFADGKTELAWAELPPLPAGTEKICCNLLAVAGEALPRGGRLEVAVASGGSLVVVSGTGIDARFQPGVLELLEGPPDLDELVPRTAQVAFTAALARRRGLRIAALQPTAERIEIRLFR